MISCFKGGSSEVHNENFGNPHAAFYVNTSEFGQDDVPKLSKIIESLRQYDVYKYAAYRTAFKLRIIQKASKLHLVDLTLIQSIIKGYELCEQSLNEIITSSKAESLLTALYTEAGNKVGFTEEPVVMAQLFLAFLQNVFVKNDKPLFLFQMKIALAFFSTASLRAKYKYFFYNCSRGSIMNKQNLHMLLESLSKLAEVVGEQMMFGEYLVPAAVKNFMKFCKGKITEKKFQKWLSLEPQTLVWISTFQRIIISETAQHFVSCDNCQTNPVIGLRYKCLHCIHYNLCQNCFLCGCINKRHKAWHPTYEYCQPASTWEETKTTISAVKNKLPFSHCPSKPYLSFDDDSLYNSMRSSTRSSFKKTTSVYLIKELSHIIGKLEEKNLKQNDETVSSESAVAEKWDSNLEIQVKRLNKLLQTLKQSSNDESLPKKQTVIMSPVPHLPFNNHYFESTPINSFHLQARDLNKMSTITKSPTEMQCCPLKESTNVFSISQSCSLLLESENSDLSNASKTNFFPAITDKENTSLDFTTILDSTETNLVASKTFDDYSGSIKPLEPSFQYLEEQSFEKMEMELHAMLEQLEKILPQVSIFKNDSLAEKEKLFSTLSDLETAVKKLSHLSLEGSTGSTDL